MGAGARDRPPPGPGSPRATGRACGGTPATLCTDLEASALGLGPAVSAARGRGVSSRAPAPGKAKPRLSLVVEATSGIEGH